MILLHVQFPTWWDYTQDILEFVAAGFAFFLAIREFGKSIKERKRGNEEAEKARRLEQAKAAREIIHEMHDNSYASAATGMLDWFLFDPSLLNGFDLDDEFKDAIDRITFDQIVNTLVTARMKSFPSKPDDQLILRSFDWFFYYIDRIEQYINDGLIRWDNVKYIFYPYYKKLKQAAKINDRDVNSEHVYKEFILFMEDRDYILAPKFWKRYSTDGAFSDFEKLQSEK